MLGAAPAIRYSRASFRWLNICCRCKLCKYSTGGRSPAREGREDISRIYLAFARMPGIQVKRSIYKNTPKTYNITHSLARKYTKTKIMVSFLQFKVSEIKEKPKMLVCSCKCCQTSTPQNEVNCEKSSHCSDFENLSDLIYPILVTREDMLLVDAWNKYFSYLCLVWEYLEVKQHQQLVKRSFLADRAFSGWSGSAAAAGGDLWRCEDALVAAVARSCWAPARAACQES